MTREEEKKINVLKERAAAGEEMVHFRTIPCSLSDDEWKKELESTRKDEFLIIAEYFDWHYPREVGGRLSFYSWKKGVGPRTLVTLRAWTEEDLWPLPLYDDIRNETNEDEIRKIFCDNIGKGLFYQDSIFRDDNNPLIKKIKDIVQESRILFNGDLSALW